MIVQNINNNQVLIRHATLIDVDNNFQLQSDLSLEAILFDDFFKSILRDKKIGVQIVECVDSSLSFKDYFCPFKIWKNTLEWIKWAENFKKSHCMSLYFYEPNNNMINLFDGYIDSSLNISSSFNNKEQCEEHFIIEKYEIIEQVIKNVQIEICTDIIYQAIQKSTLPKCIEILKQFQYFKLEKSLPNSNDKDKNKNKL